MRIRTKSQYRRLEAVLPFGMELGSLSVMGYRTLSGWYDYECRPRLYMAFWNEFWTAAGVENGGAGPSWVGDCAMRSDVTLMGHRLR